MTARPGRPPAPSPPRPEPGLVERLRADLAPVTPAALAAGLGPEATAALARESRVPGLLATAAPAPERDAETARVVARLFLLGAPVPSADLDRALPHLGAAGVERLGLVTSASGTVRAVVDLQPVEVEGEHLWLAADLGERHTGRAVAPDHVLSVGGASLTLAALTVRRPVARALDLGTGCGIQAAHLTRHAAEVVATDLSGRALAFAAFNAALNDQRWDLRRGSLLEPVAGERFDLIVSNPPFVITPAAAHDAGLPVMGYREAAAGGDRLLADLLRALPAHLTPGGTAQLLGNWEHRRGADWRDRLAAWAAEVELDLWFVQREVLDAAEYVEMWLRDGGLPSTDREHHEAVAAAWLRDFHARGVEAIGLGHVVARRPRGGRPWVRIEEATGPVRGPLGDHVAGVLDAVEWLRADDGARLTGARLATAPDVTLEHHFRPGEPHPAVILARQGGGYGRAIPLDTATAGLLDASDGELTVGQVLAALAVLLEVPADGLAAELLPRVRDLVLDGMLVPAG